MLRVVQAVAELPHPHALPREAGRHPPRRRSTGPMLGLPVGERRRHALVILVGADRLLPTSTTARRRGRGFAGGKIEMERHWGAEAVTRGRGLGIGVGGLAR
jgi:hypothetical protein